jgi:hypothetical protein
MPGNAPRIPQLRQAPVRRGDQSSGESGPIPSIRGRQQCLAPSAGAPCLSSACCSA